MVLLGLPQSFYCPVHSFVVLYGLVQVLHECVWSFIFYSCTFGNILSGPYGLALHIPLWSIMVLYGMYGRL